METMFLLTQIDHLSGEEIGWAMMALDIDGVHNRNIIPTLTKKGRVGYLLLLEIDPAAEKKVGSVLMEKLDTHGYHKIKTTHIYCETIIKEINITIEHGEELVQTKGRLKRRKDKVSGPYFLESDDLFAIEQLFSEKFGFTIPIKKLRQLIEHGFETSKEDSISIRI